MYRNISMAQRLDRIGELLAKGVYLYLKKEKMKTREENGEENIKNNKVVPADPPKNIS